MAIGLGQKFYFSKHLSLRFDLRLFAFNGPIPFKGGNPGIKTTTSVPSLNSFEEKLMMTSNLDLGLSYLF